MPELSSAMPLDEKALEAAKLYAKSETLLVLESGIAGLIRAYLSSLTPSPVGELVAKLSDPDLWHRDELEYIDPLCKQAAASLTSLSAEVARKDAEIERLREALFVADDTIMSLNGGFPLYRNTPELDRLHRAAKLIRSFTSDDYLERKRMSDAALSAPKGGEHE